MAYLYERDGAEFFATTTTSGSQLGGKIAVLADGSFVVVWYDTSTVGGDPDIGVKAQLFDANGAKVGGEFLVNTTTAGNQLAANVAPLQSGGFVVTWGSATGPSDYAITGQIFAANGTPVGGEFVANTVTSGNQSAPVVAGLTGGGFVIAWQDSSGIGGDASGVGIKAQIFDAAGAKVGGEFLANTTTTGSQFAADVAAVSGGGFAIAWTSTAIPNTNSVQLFDALGAKVGSEQSLPQIPYDSVAAAPRIAALGTGYIAVWGESATDGSTTGMDIKAQFFDAGGAKVGVPFVLNGGVAGDQFPSAIRAVPGGGFVVIWNVTADEDGQTDVHAQFFDANGQRSGSEFVVNADAGANQVATSVAALPSGEIVIAWTDNGAFDVKLQLLAPSNSPASDIAISNTSVSETAIENLAVATLSASGDTVNASYSFEIAWDSTGGAFAIDGDQLVVADNARLNFESAPTANVRVRATDQNGQGYEETLSLQITDAAIEVRRSADDAFQIGAEDAGHETVRSITPLASGGFLAVYASESGVESVSLAQVFGADGEPVGDGFELDLSERYSSEVPEIAALAGGGFVAVNNGPAPNSDATVVVQRFDSAGNEVGGETSLDAGYFGGVSQVVALDGGGYIVTWSRVTPPEGNGFYTFELLGQVFDANGVATGSEFLFDADPATERNATALAALPGGGFVAVWRETDVEAVDDTASIRGQFFTATGATVGDAFTVLAETTDLDGSMSVVVLTSGKLLVTWSKETDLGDDIDELTFRILDADGSILGDPIIVATGDVEGNTFAATPGGGFFVNWAIDLEDGPKPLFGRFFDGTGAAVGDTFEIAAASSGDFAPAAVLAGGEVVAVWNYYDDVAMDTDAFARIIGPAAPLKEAFALPAQWTTANSGDEGWYAGDYDGDGKDDVFRYVDGQSGADMFLSNGTGFVADGSWTGAGTGDDGWYVADYNGDGKDDVLRYRQGSSGAEVFLSNGTSFDYAGSWSPAGNGDDGWHLGDFNGDGKDDVFRYLDGVSGAQVFLSNGSGFDFAGSWTGAGNGDEGWYLGDFNGDGKDDIFRYVEGVSGAQVFLSNGAGFDFAGSWTGAGTGDDGWTVADYNGDGRDDVLRYRQGDSGAEVFLSSGTSFDYAGSWSPAGNGNEGWSAGDFTGDGTADLLRVTTGGAEVLI